MDYNINEFVDRLRTRMYYRFPYERDFINIVKHRGRTGHIRDIAFMNNGINIVSENMITFDIGNEQAEKEYPYYHILEEAPVIRKRGEATEKTRGSQGKISNLAKRDYNLISFNGKTFTKEYAKNVRGSRKQVIERARNKDIETTTYENIHYKYIEKMLSAINPILADEFNMKLARTENASLATDFILGETDIGLYDSEYLDIAFGLGML